MKRRSSLRRTEAPIPVALMADPLDSSFGRFPSAVSLAGLSGGEDRSALFGSPGGGLAAAHRAGAGGDRLDDVVIAGAAADVAFKLLADGAVVELVALAAHNVDRG